MALSSAQGMKHQAHPKLGLTGRLTAFNTPPGFGGEVKGMVIAAVWTGPEASPGHLGSGLKSLFSHAFDVITRIRIEVG